MPKARKGAKDNVVFILKMAPKSPRVFELIPKQNFFHKVDLILNEPEDVRNRGGDYLLPFPRMMELEVQEAIYKQLLQEKRMTKRNLIALRETAKKMQTKFRNYWKSHSTNPENYDKHTGKHCAWKVWEHFLDCKEYVLKSNVQSDSEDKWKLNLAYQVDDGKLSEKKKWNRPINRYIAEKTLKLKSHKELPGKVAQFEEAVEMVTEENLDIKSRLEEIARKQGVLVEQEWENAGSPDPLEYFAEGVWESPSSNKDVG